MATGTAESLLDKISQGHLECSICVGRIDNPKMLNCQHSFCLNCLQNQIKKLRGNRKVQMLTCPCCNKKTLLTGENVADLPTDIKLTALLDDVDSYERYSERPTAILKCDKHNQGLNIYCDTCKKLECTTCIVLNMDQGHTNHTLLGLPEALNKCKQEFTQLVPKVQGKIADLSVDMEEAAKSYKKFMSKVEETNEKISQQANSEVARIREEEKKLKQDATWFYNDKAEAIKTGITSVTQAEQKLGEVEQLMAQESSYEILRLIEKPLRDIEKLTEVQQNKASDEKLPFTDFKGSFH